MKKIIKNKKYHGFYLVEAIIALFLITVGLLVTVDLLSSTMKNTFEDRDNITAVLLAQEGVELVRNLRDNNFALGLEAFEAPRFPSTTNLCSIDKNSPRLFCGAEKNFNLNLSNKFYVTGSGSKFKRRVAIQYSGDGTASDPTNDTAVTVTVIWKGDMSSDFPADGTLATKCTAAKGCAYVEVHLTRWN
ncbi:MAG: hypothetical protein WCV59_00030 [Parcubacteria group bacterium]|jgi:competence protein ComGC